MGMAGCYPRPGCRRRVPVPSSFAMSHPTVLEVVPGSPAAAAGLGVGDELVAVNGVTPDRRHRVPATGRRRRSDLHRRAGAGSRSSCRSTKPEGHPVGLRLNASIFDRVQTCDNHCEFCFIYQLPPGMRQVAVPEGRRLPIVVPVRQLHDAHPIHRARPRPGRRRTPRAALRVDPRHRSRRCGPTCCAIRAAPPACAGCGPCSNATSPSTARSCCAPASTTARCSNAPVPRSWPATRGWHRSASCRSACLASIRRSDSRCTPRRRPKSDLEIIHFWQDQAEDRLGRRMFFASDELYLRPVAACRTRLPTRTSSSTRTASG